MGHSNIEHLINLSDEDLLEKLGFELAVKRAGIKPFSRMEAKMYAERWLARNRERLRENICDDPRIVALMESKKHQNQMVLAATILDVMAAFMGTVGLVTLSVLLAKEGLDILCKVN